MAGGDEDNQVVVPIRTALRRLFNATWLNTIVVSVDDSRGMADAEREIGAVLRERHRVGAEEQPDFETFLALQQETAETLRRLTTGVAAVALIVGGTGILALMLLSVRERTGEIGLRMAVGAQPRDILVQFLFEATLALGGWTGGIVLGSTGATVVALEHDLQDWRTVGGAPHLARHGDDDRRWVPFPARRASLVLRMQALRTE